MYYNVLMTVPPQYDGQSRVFFPEAHYDNGKVAVEILRDIKNPSYFYPDSPGIENREWKKGKIVFVPEKMSKIYESLNYLQRVP